MADPVVAMTAKPTYPWEFKPRFRRHAFGWKSQPAITRVKQAVTEIKKVARRDPVLAAEGAVLFLERLSPALEQVDSSSGAIGTAVNRAIAELVPLIAAAPADAGTRAAWLERLFQAKEEDQIPYIERLGDFWGELCASPTVASAWADRLIAVTTMALSSDRNLRGYFHGTSACLSALLTAERYTEIASLVEAERFWPYRRWAVKALAAQGRGADAIAYAEACRSSVSSDWEVDQLCEEILLAAGMADEAYTRYGLTANRCGTYLATFRAVAAKYPDRTARVILTDLVQTTPGEEGKWFAAAKEIGLFDEALALASSSPCDPRTLTRAARDHVEAQPSFALGAGLLALHWLVQGYGYEITGADLWAAYACTMAAAERTGQAVPTKARIRAMVAAMGNGNEFVVRVLGRELELA